jgi:hypothetical protein
LSCSPRPVCCGQPSWAASRCSPSCRIGVGRRFPCCRPASSC